MQRVDCALSSASTSQPLECRAAHKMQSVTDILDVQLLLCGIDNMFINPTLNIVAVDDELLPRSTIGVSYWRQQDVEARTIFAANRVSDKHLSSPRRISSFLREYGT